MPTSIETSLVISLNTRKLPFNINHDVSDFSEKSCMWSYYWSHHCVNGLNTKL